MKTINKIRVNNFKGMIEMTEKGETKIYPYLADRKDQHEQKQDQ